MEFNVVRLSGCHWMVCPRNQTDADPFHTISSRLKRLAFAKLPLNRVPQLRSRISCREGLDLVSFHPGISCTLHCGATFFLCVASSLQLAVNCDLPQVNRSTTGFIIHSSIMEWVSKRISPFIAGPKFANNSIYAFISGTLSLARVNAGHLVTGGQFSDSHFGWISSSSVPFQWPKWQYFQIPENRGVFSELKRTTIRIQEDIQGFRPQPSFGHLRLTLFCQQLQLKRSVAAKTVTSLIVFIAVIVNAPWPIIMQENPALSLLDTFFSVLWLEQQQ